MEHIGIDVHKTTSQLCVLTEEGEVIERRIKTTRDSLASHLAKRPKARILLEASTESEWVACCLEELGHEVVVADPNFASMYATRTRKVKTDRRDARALCEACRLGAYRPAHRPPPERRHQRAELRVRTALVRTRARYISLIGAIVRRDGYRIPPGGSKGFLQRIAAVELPEYLRVEIEPLLDVMELLNLQIAEADKQLAQHISGDTVAKRLVTVPGVGPVTALTFTAVLDTCERFPSAREVRAYAGLVPREMSSGERQQRGRITKAGNSQLRSLLVEVAWCVMRTRKAEAQPLQQWAQQIAARRGKRIAAVALARKLAGVLYAMWRDGTEFGQPKSASRAPATTLAA